MPSWKTLWEKTFTTNKPGELVPAGMYAYQQTVDGQPLRFHLRVDPTGDGVLLANANTAARLSVTGVLFAKRLLEGESLEAIAAETGRQFAGASTEQIHADLSKVRRLIDSLGRADGSYPLVNLQDAEFAPSVAPLAKPISVDVPLAEPERLVKLLDRLWEMAFAHVTLLAVESPNAEYLLRAVERAEDLGMIAGVRIRASDLAAGPLLNDLATAGIDHLNLPCLSAEATVHDQLLGAGDHARLATIIERAQRLEVCTVAETALLESTLPDLDALMELLGNWNIAQRVFYAIVAGEELPEADRQQALTPIAVVQAAAMIEETLTEEDFQALWSVPVRRDPALSITEQILAGPRASGDFGLRVEPNGAVVPPRGPWEVVGNVFDDDWATIEQHPAYVRYRTRVTTPTHCDECPGLAICAADCPQAPAGWADSRPKEAK